MKQFAIAPTIEVHDSADEFIDSLRLSPTDCVFTARFLADTRFAGDLGGAQLLAIEDFGLGEPSDDLVDRVRASFRPDCRRIIAVGGGAVLDVAKLLGLRATGTTEDWFTGRAPVVKERELVLVPTTCGTGSEVTNISVLAFPSLVTKKGLALPALLADRAVLVPEFVHGLPEYVFVTSSVDALSHALESYVAPKSNDFTELFAVPAIREILTSYRRFLAEGRKATIPSVARGMLIASNYAGIAFGNTGVGAVHALSYPLGGTYHVAHGEANARFLTAVFNAYRSKDDTGRMDRLSDLVAEVLELPAGNDPWDAINQMVSDLLPYKPLRDYGMREDEIESFADGVIVNQQRLLANNCVPLSRDEIRDIYRNLW